MSDLAELCETARNYANHGWRPGSFSMAVLKNDLFGALGNSDQTSHLSLLALCTYISMHLPDESYGSPKRVDEWLKTGGLAAQGRPLVTKRNLGDEP